jgi:hypothetical protein
MFGAMEPFRIRHKGAAKSGLKGAASLNSWILMKVEMKNKAMLTSLISFNFLILGEESPFPASEGKTVYAITRA